MARRDRLCVLAFWSLDITWDRFVIGLENGAKFLGSMIPPNFERWKLLLGNLLETLEIAVIASAFGVAFSCPSAWPPRAT